MIIIALLILAVSLIKGPKTVRLLSGMIRKAKL